MEETTVVVLDFGSQYTENIAASCSRELGIEPEVYEGDIEIAKIGKPKMIIGSGGPASAYEKGSPRCDPRIWDMDAVKLAICYTFQAYAHDFGGRTIPAEKAGEYGKAELVVEESGQLFSGTPKNQTVWMSHGDRISELPPSMKRLAYTKDCENAAAWDPKRKLFGVQFHPEVHETEHGRTMLDNLLKMCGELERRPWTYETYIAETPGKIRQQVRGRHVVHMTSGGKDSTLAGIEFKEAGVPTDYIHIDNGTERERDVAEMRALCRSLDIEPFVLETADELERELDGVTDAEKKREIIGDHYIRHAIRFAHERYGNNWMIGIGTIWPDHIESKGSKFSARIVTHHNRSPEVMKVFDRVVEPNLHLFKEDVEAIIKLKDNEPKYKGIARLLVKKHPFPGPGLAIRAICSNGTEPEGMEQLSEDVNSIANKYDLKGGALPILSAGVGGEGRSYLPPAVVWGKQRKWSQLEKASIEITNRLRGRTNRVVYAWEPEGGDAILQESYVTKARLARLRKADTATMDTLEKHGLMGKIQQCPTIDLPVGTDGKPGFSTVIRPFVTVGRKFMTGRFGRLPVRAVDEMAMQHLELGYARVYYDIGNKPPARTEWE